METDALITTFAEARIVPVIRAGSAVQAATAAEWLIEAGFSILEFTCTTPGAFDLVEAHARSGGPLVGLGTILSAEDADRAINSGAAFLVTPCRVEGVIERGREAGVPVLVGAATPTEIWQAHGAGAAVVKLFPAASLGGPGFLRAVTAVFPDVPLMPTGGVGPDAVADYIASGAVAVGMGSELAPQAMIERGARAEVVALGRELLRKVRR